MRPASSASSRPAHSGIVSPGSSLPPGSTQYGSLSGFWCRTRSRAPSRSTTAATRTPKSIPITARSLPMRRVYPPGGLRDVRRLFLLALRPAQLRDLGLQLVAGFDHQAQTFVFGERSVIGFEDTGLCGWVAAGSMAVVKEDGEPFVLHPGELQDRVQVGGYGLVARSSGNRRVEQLIAPRGGYRRSGRRDRSRLPGLDPGVRRDGGRKARHPLSPPPYYRQLPNHRVRYPRSL